MKQGGGKTRPRSGSATPAIMYGEPAKYSGNPGDAKRNLDAPPTYSPPFYHENNGQRTRTPMRSKSTAYLIQTRLPDSVAKRENVSAAPGAQKAPEVKDNENSQRANDAQGWASGR
jgi:hypothetical protein